MIRASIILLLLVAADASIHTVKHGPGEVRDQWRPLDGSAAARTLAAVDWTGSTPGRPMPAGHCH